MASMERLSKYNVFRSNDLGESEAMLSRTLCPHVLKPRSNEAICMVQNMVKLEHSELAYLHYGIQMEVHEASSDDHYLFIIPQHGNSVITTNGVRVHGGTERGYIITAGHLFDSRTAACSIVWRIKRRALEDCARAVLGEDFNNVIAFAPSVQLNEGPTTSIGRAMNFMISELEQDEGLFQSSHAIERLEQSLMHALIALQPSNISAMAGKRRVTIAPRCVRRVEDYIMANAGEQILLSDLIAVSGVCGRTLFRTFRQFREVSPMEYLRQTRLRMVRQSLLQSRGSETVTAVLTKWGITQFGRFAADYRRQYGELPSETLRSSRGDFSADGYPFSPR